MDFDRGDTDVPALMEPAERGRRSFIGRARRFLGPAHWLVMDQWRCDRMGMTMAFTQNLLGMAATAAALGGLLMTASALESGRPVVLLGYALPMSNVAVIIVVTAAAALGCFGAFALYGARKRAAAMVTRYKASCVQRILAVLRERRDGSWVSALGADPAVSMRRLSTRGLRRAALVLEDAIASVVPVLAFLASVAVMVVIEPVLVAGFIPLAAFYVLHLADIAGGGAVAQARYREHLPQLSKSMRGLFAEAAVQRRPDGEVQADWRALRVGDFERVDQFYHGRKLASFRARTLTSLLTYAAIAGLFLLYALDSGVGRSWTGFVTILVVLRVATGSLNQLSATLVRVKRTHADYTPIVRLLTLGPPDQRDDAAADDTPEVTGSLRFVRPDQGATLEGLHDTLALDSAGLAWILLSAARDDLALVALRWQLATSCDAPDLIAGGWLGPAEHLSDSVDSSVRVVSVAGRGDVMSIREAVAAMGGVSLLVVPSVDHLARLETPDDSVMVAGPGGILGFASVHEVLEVGRSLESEGPATLIDDGEDDEG